MGIFVNITPSSVAVLSACYLWRHDEHWYVAVRINVWLIVPNGNWSFLKVWIYPNRLKILCSYWDIRLFGWSTTKFKYKQNDRHFRPGISKVLFGRELDCSLPWKLCLICELAIRLYSCNDLAPSKRQAIFQSLFMSMCYFSRHCIIPIAGGRNQK